MYINNYKNRELNLIRGKEEGERAAGENKKKKIRNI